MFVTTLEFVSPARVPSAATVAPPLGIVKLNMPPELYPVAGELQVPGVLAVGVPPSVRTHIVAPDVESETVMVCGEEYVPLTGLIEGFATVPPLPPPEAALNATKNAT